MDKNAVDSQSIYTKQLINKKIIVPFNKYSLEIVNYFLEYANKNFMGRCCKEGYISGDYVKVIKYSAPKLDKNDLHFDIVFEFNVYYPYEEQELYTYISNITKIGIKSVFSVNDNKNPLTVFVSRLQNPHAFINQDNVGNNEIEKSSNNYNNGDVIKIKIIGYRFEVNDSSVYALGELIKEK